MKRNPSEYRSHSKRCSNSQKARAIADCGRAQQQAGKSDRHVSRPENVASLLGAKPTPAVSLTEDHIQSLLAMRRARSSILGGELFSDPAWDILLELYAAKLGHRKASLEELARSSGTPLSTTRRWVAALEGDGLAQQMRDPTEGAYTRISLTAEGVARMERLANQWGSAFVSIRLR